VGVWWVGRGRSGAVDVVVAGERRGGSDASGVVARNITVASVVSDEGVVCVVCLSFQPIKHLVIAMWKVAQSVAALGLNIVRYQKQSVRLMDAR